jgi:hypothetical protein
VLVDADVGSVTAIMGTVAALIAAVGGVSAAWVGVHEYRLKTASQRVEIDVKLSQLLAELVPIANGRGPTMTSEAAAEGLTRTYLERNATAEEISAALRASTFTVPVGEVTQASAIASIGYLGTEHPALREPAYSALLALEYVASPSLLKARNVALKSVEAARR